MSETETPSVPEAAPAVVNEKIAETVEKTETVATDGDSKVCEAAPVEQQKNGDDKWWENASNIYEFTVKDLDGNDVSMSKYKDKALIVVNVASNCGFTKTNYNQLNELYEKYNSAGLCIAAFPCNQFAGQEPGCETDIKEFIKKNNVKFDVYAKIDVNGANAHPLYRWLKQKQKGILGTLSIKWNFTKFLVNKEGIPIKRYSPTTSPSSIEPDIKALLNLS